MQRPHSAVAIQGIAVLVFREMDVGYEVTKLRITAHEMWDMPQLGIWLSGPQTAESSHRARPLA